MWVCPLHAVCFESQRPGIVNTPQYDLALGLLYECAACLQVAQTACGLAAFVGQFFGCTSPAALAGYARVAVLACGIAPGTPPCLASLAPLVACGVSDYCGLALALQATNPGLLPG